MKILIVTPAPRRSRRGNRVTALRWAGILRRLGHRVAISDQYRDEPCDVLLALHARKSHASIARFRGARPRGALVLALTGTDIYGERESPKVLEAIDAASRLVVLQPRAVAELPEKARPKARVIHQSAVVPPPARDGSAGQPDSALNGWFDVCVSGHLRDVKDPLRAALAARLLPPSSRIRILHVGEALTEDMALRAREEAATNPRYHWLGEVPRGEALRILAQSRLLVVTSLLEGGANAVSEAIAASVPVLASRIPGSTGILGDDYPGLFPVGDTEALAELMARVETDEPFYRALAERCEALKPLVDPCLELESWRRLLAELPREDEAGRLEFVEGGEALDPVAFARDVAEGLTSAPKRLQCRYFYDHEGSRLFEEICDLPEYYLSRDEREILSRRAREIVSLVPPRPSIVEFGSGNAAKTRLLFDALRARDGTLRYVPIDISRSVLEATSRTLLDEYPELEIAAVAGGYEDGLRQLEREAGRAKLVLWLGSNIGNFERAEAAAFLRSVGALLGADGRALVGIDLRKAASVLVPAYADSRGVTARFNKNILARINRELGGRFDLERFEHLARYDEHKGRIEMYLVSTSRQVVPIEGLGTEVSFDEGERVHTENSYKYSEEEIDELVRAAGLRTLRRWLDDAGRFSVNLFAR